VLLNTIVVGCGIDKRIVRDSYAPSPREYGCAMPRGVHVLGE
jgi:hypothetical protein